MQVLMYEPAFERIRQRLERMPGVEPVLMRADSSLWHRGEPIDGHRAAPVAAWINSDLYAGGPLRDFMVRCLKSPTLRWVQSSAAGYEHPVFAKLIANGIDLSTSNASSISIAEFVVAAVFDAFQPQERRRALQRERRWEHLPFREICGTRWMLIGLGNIGRELALRVRALGAEVIGVRRTPRGDEPVARMIAADSRPALLEALPGCDVIVVCAAANPANEHSVNAEFLAQLRPGAILINVARGALIDEAALITSLAGGRPALAILDVFEREPLPAESPLWTLPNVRITAHNSAAGSGFAARNDELFLGNLERFTRGERPLHLVDAALVRASTLASSGA